MKADRNLFKEGYNCSQSVFCSYCEQFGIDFDTGLKLSSSFGGGIGRLRNVCGAISGLCMLIGLKQGYTSPDNDEIKEKHYAKVQELVKKFENKFGSVICKELLNFDEKNFSPKPTKRTNEFYQNRPCEKFIKYACELFEEETKNPTRM